MPRKRRNVDPAKREATGRRDSRLSYAELLELAETLRPPQRWFDEKTNPFKRRSGPYVSGTTAAILGSVDS